ncbi:cation:proton antiporter [Chloroflexota bacterium]
MLLERFIVERYITNVIYETRFKENLSLGIEQSSRRIEMDTLETEITLFILLMGGIILLTILIRYGLRHGRIPSIVGFVLLGIVIRLLDARWGFITSGINEVFGFVATVGIIILLFRVGLESNLSGLMRQLKRASLIWVGNILLSGGLGYGAAYFLLDLAIIPSLFVAIALTATSVAIPVGVWQEANALQSPTGELLVDSAEMDDVSGIILMVLLFAAAPILRSGTGVTLVPVLAKELGLSLLKLIGLVALCVLFSRYLEHPITKFFKTLEPATCCPLLVIIAFGFLIAALSGLVGFSVVIGAFFAGLIFSRDPEAVKQDVPLSISIRTLHSILLYQHRLEY